MRVRFYGDVLNTAARIQGMCNELGEQFLISEELRAALNSDKKMQMQAYETVILRGKQEAVNLWGVRRGVDCNFGLL